MRRKGLLFSGSSRGIQRIVVALVLCPRICNCFFIVWLFFLVKTQSEAASHFLLIIDVIVQYIGSRVLVLPLISLAFGSPGYQ
jgi:hypothetical protein